MNPSIKTFLLINLLFIVTLITSVAVLGDLFLTRKDIQKDSDLRLIHDTLQLKALVNTCGLSDKKSSVIQHKLIYALKQYKRVINSTACKTGNNTKRVCKSTNPSYGFEIWRNNNLLLYSGRATSANTKFPRVKNGLATVNIHHENWRVSSVTDPKTQLTFVIKQELERHQFLINVLTQNAIIVIIVTCPFLALLIWLIVGRSLDPLKRTTAKVKSLAPNHIEPLNLTMVPSEIKPLINALNDLFGRLNDAMDKEKRFTADAAHELRTPLAILKTHTQIALKTDDIKEKERALMQILSGVNRSTHVVQQLLTLSRITPESGINDPVVMNLKQAAIDTIAQLVPEAISKNIELELSAEQENYSIYGNPTAIGILLRNLIDNAIRYSTESSTVTVALTEESDHKILLQVIDNGPGIEPKLRKRVFDRFFRVVGNKATGSGLGLNIVAQIVKLHGGEIRLETSPGGKGLDFQILFPPANNTND